MIKRNQRYFNLLNMLSDAALIFLSYLIATYIRFDVMYGEAPSLWQAWNEECFIVATVYSVVIVVMNYFVHLYTAKRTQAIAGVVLRIMSVNMLGVLGISAFLYFTRLSTFSRIAIIIFYLISTASISLKHVVVHSVLRSMRNRGVNLKHVILVGDGELAHQYAKSLADNPWYGFQIDGYVSRADKPELGTRLCAYEELERWLDSHETDSVIIALEPHECSHMNMIIEACERQGVTASIIPFFHRHFPAQPTIDVVGETKLINIRATPLDDALKANVKRIFDVVFSLIVMIVTSPIMLIAAVGIKLSSPGPIIFKQVRVGLNKHPFTMYKFRSMRVNPREATGWSKDEDPRKTRFGSFLRKCSIDELPQFFNVFKGDMSVVGPRPEVPHFVERFKNEIPMYMLKHQVRPGITGWAQVQGYRGDTSIEKRIQCDLWYIENWSFRLDIKILFRTVFGGMINSEKIAPTSVKS